MRHSLLVALVLLTHGPTTVLGQQAEWGGIFALHTNPSVGYYHYWSMQKVNGAYADPFMKIVFVGTTGADMAGLRATIATATALFAGQCTAVEAEADARAEAAEDDESAYEFEPSEDVILAELLPRNVGVQVFKALLETIMMARMMERSYRKSHKRS